MLPERDRDVRICGPFGAQVFILIGMGDFHWPRVAFVDRSTILSVFCSTYAAYLQSWDILGDPPGDGKITTEFASVCLMEIEQIEFSGTVV